MIAILYANTYENVVCKTKAILYRHRLWTCSSLSIMQQMELARERTGYTAFIGLYFK